MKPFSNIVDILFAFIYLLLSAAASVRKVIVHGKLQWTEMCVFLEVYTTFNAAHHSKNSGENVLVYSCLIPSFLTSAAL